MKIPPLLEEALYLFLLPVGDKMNLQYTILTMREDERSSSIENPKSQVHSKET